MHPNGEPPLLTAQEVGVELLHLEILHRGQVRFSRDLGEDGPLVVVAK
jgi:hypothetical protein